MRLIRFAAAAAASFLAAGLLGGVSPASPSHAADPVTVSIRPDAMHVASALGTAPTTAYCEKHYKIACYLPGQIEQAYGLPALYRRGVTGRGQTIVIVDSYGSPTVGHDLAVFDKVAGLPAPPSLTIIQPAGRVRPYRPNSNREGWAGETDLDVEYAHAIAPGARILLVETPTAENEGTTGFPQIVKAEKYVISHHLGGVISQSFSATEETFPSRASLLSLRGAYIEAAAAGVTVLAASGDSGAADVRYNGSTYYLHPVTSWPDSDPLVTGVGGTQLHLAAAGPPAAPTVWNDTYNVPTNEYIVGNKGPNPLAGGGGKSVIFGRPGYQDGVRQIVGDQRGVPDISMSGACNGAADMYQSFAGQAPGWYPTCGTSEATPEFAGIVALADQVAGHPLGLINPDLYLLSRLRAPGITDVVSGSNTVSFRQDGRLYTIRGFTAGPGYDLASGVGTVNAPRFVPELACLAGHRRGTSLRQAAARCSRA
ncbi:MAG: S8 family serine peptidase [Streptosporangiaceae bacterium]|jgi:subtilase family serine protease|nr:protease [Actinomycetota bacterium]